MPSALESPEGGEEDVLHYEEIEDDAVRSVLSYTMAQTALGKARDPPGKGVILFIWKKRGTPISD